MFIGSDTDQEIFDAVVKVVAAYVNGLRFSQTDDAGNLIRSPFDVFLSRNGLPQQPNSGETPLDYNRRLLTLVNRLVTPQFVMTGQCTFHQPNPSSLERRNWQASRYFLQKRSLHPPPHPQNMAAGLIGNCLACYAEPNFTDFKLHNTGVVQREYDDSAAGAGHDTGSFAALPIPNLAT